MPYDPLLPEERLSSRTTAAPRLRGLQFCTAPEGADGARRFSPARPSFARGAAPAEEDAHLEPPEEIPNLREFSAARSGPPPSRLGGLGTAPEGAAGARRFSPARPSFARGAALAEEEAQREPSEDLPFPRSLPSARSASASSHLPADTDTKFDSSRGLYATLWTEGDTTAPFQ